MGATCSVLIEGDAAQECNVSTMGVVMGTYEAPGEIETGSFALE